MSTVTLQILEKALVLSPVERAALIESLLASLDQPTGPDDADGARQVGGLDPALDAAEARAALAPAMAKLGDRERQIIKLRFEDELTQSQIAERVGISQMHVSRLLAASLRRIREDLTAG